MKLMFFVRGHYPFIALTVLTAFSQNLMYNVYIAHFESFIINLQKVLRCTRVHLVMPLTPV